MTDSTRASDVVSVAVEWLEHPGKLVGVPTGTPPGWWSLVRTRAGARTYGVCEWVKGGEQRQVATEAIAAAVVEVAYQSGVAITEGDVVVQELCARWDAQPARSAGNKPPLATDPCTRWLRRQSKAALLDCVVDLLRTDGTAGCDDEVSEERARQRLGPVLRLRGDSVGA